MYINKVCVLIKFTSVLLQLFENSMNLTLTRRKSFDSSKVVTRRSESKGV